MDMGLMGRSADDQRWLQMLASLAPMSLFLAVKDAEASGASAVSDYKPRDFIRNSVCVEILERLSPTSIVISWADATSGRYGEQTWTLRSARRKGVCSLSGEPFSQGTLVYRPNVRRGIATNTNQSISAAAIARLERGAPARPVADADAVRARQRG
jgi:hypothetical protein